MMIEPVAVDLNDYLIGDIHTIVKSGWCQGDVDEYDEVHITLTNGAVPYCGLKGRHRRGDHHNIKHPMLCGHCHQRMKWFGVLRPPA